MFLWLDISHIEGIFQWSGKFYFWPKIYPRKNGKLVVDIPEVPRIQTNIVLNQASTGILMSVKL